MSKSEVGRSRGTHCSCTLFTVQREQSNLLHQQFVKYQGLRPGGWGWWFSKKCSVSKLNPPKKF